MRLKTLRKLSFLPPNWFGTRQSLGSPDFAILIFINYANWIVKQNGKENGKEMRLEAVKNDVRRVLRFLRYRHGDQLRTWKFLLDFPCEFTDHEGVTRFLPTMPPTRDAI
ncbi:hypothetical protein FRC01_011751, partial [Tulasnella sp. 417]